ALRPRAADHARRGAPGARVLARSRPLYAGARGQGRPPVHHGQVPHDARRRGARDRAGARCRERSPRDVARTFPPRDAPRRAAAALESPPRRHELRRAAPGAAGVRRAVRAGHPGLRRALPGASRAHRLCAGERRVPHVAHHQAQVRPRLHPQPLAVARPEDSLGDREGHPDAPGRVTAPAGCPRATEGPPAWARGAADALLAFTVVSIPLSTSGMQIGVVGLAILAGAAAVGRWGILRRTPLDGALALLFGVLAASTLASGDPLRAGG